MTGRLRLRVRSARGRSSSQWPWTAPSISLGLDPFFEAQHSLMKNHIQAVDTEQGYKSQNRQRCHFLQPCAGAQSVTFSLKATIIINNHLPNSQISPENTRTPPYIPEKLLRGMQLIYPKRFCCLVRHPRHELGCCWTASLTRENQQSLPNRWTGDSCSAGRCSCQFWDPSR